MTRTYLVTHEDGRSHNVEGMEDVSAAMEEGQRWSDSPVEAIVAVRAEVVTLFPCACGKRFIPTSIRESRKDGALTFNCPNCGASHIVWREEN